jgi:large subunit ribosomal protein L4
MRRLAIKSALSDKVANEQLIVLKDLALESPRTKEMLAFLANLPVDGKKILMMLPKRDENIVLSTRNIPSAKVQHVSSINVVELLKHDYVIMSKETVRWIELVFGEGLSAEEASQKITAQLDEEVTATEQLEEAEELAEVPVTEATEDNTPDQEQESETEAPIDGGEE